jgi:transposase
MPFEPSLAALELPDDVREHLTAVSRSRTKGKAQVERAQMLLAYAGGEPIRDLARRFGSNRRRVERLVNRALQVGASAALDDLPRSGRPPKITAEARIWLVSLACEKPKQLGYSYELWTAELLAQHAREHCQEHGHPSLANLSAGTVSKILRKATVQPHRIAYYLERRDPDFDHKMAQVLYVYYQVHLLLEQDRADSSMVAYLSCDEKPGIQALENVAPDLPPVPGEHPCLCRDHEYVRHGTMSLIAGIDLLTGHVHGQMVERHRSCEFVEFLKQLDAYYAEEMTLRIILDNHSAHLSKETARYLATRPNRFEFIFTPTHGSWLNLIEAFFGKMAKTMLRGIRVKSKDELKERVECYLEELNKAPVVFRWKYGLEAITAA